MFVLFLITTGHFAIAEWAEGVVDDVYKRVLMILNIEHSYRYYRDATFLKQTLHDQWSLHTPNGGCSVTNVMICNTREEAEAAKAKAEAEAAKAKAEAEAAKAKAEAVKKWLEATCWVKTCEGALMNYLSLNTRQCGYLNQEMVFKLKELVEEVGNTTLDSPCGIVIPFAGNGYLAILQTCLKASIRQTDINPEDWIDGTGIKTGVFEEDARETVSHGNEQILIFMFPPYKSKVPYETLLAAIRRGGFKYLVVFQEILEAEHCGDEEYCKLLEWFNLNQVDTEQEHLQSYLGFRGFTTHMWVGKFPTHIPN